MIEMNRDGNERDTESLEGSRKVDMELVNAKTGRSYEDEKSDKSLGKDIASSQAKEIRDIAEKQHGLGKDEMAI